jgi:hypothetical protein
MHALLCRIATNNKLTRSVPVMADILPQKQQTAAAHSAKRQQPRKARSSGAR